MATPAAVNRGALGRHQPPLMVKIAAKEYTNSKTTPLVIDTFDALLEIQVPKP
jgi:hypothetical protein